MKAGDTLSPSLVFGATSPGGVSRPTVWSFQSVSVAAKIVHVSSYIGQFARPVVVTSGARRRVFTSIQGNPQAPYDAPDGYSWVNVVYSDDNFSTTPSISFFLLRTGASGSGRRTAEGVQLAGIPNSSSMRLYNPIPFTVVIGEVVSPTYERITVDFDGNASSISTGQYLGKYNAVAVYAHPTPPVFISDVFEFNASPDEVILRLGNASESVQFTGNRTPTGGHAGSNRRWAWDSKLGVGVVAAGGSGSTFTDYHAPYVRVSSSGPTAFGSIGSWAYSAGVSGKGLVMSHVAAGDGRFVAHCPVPASALSPGDLVTSTNGTSWTVQKVNAMATPSFAAYSKNHKVFIFGLSGSLTVTENGSVTEGVGLSLPPGGSALTPITTGFCE
jgi:hypothetical protein